ncbi:MAG: hypothetical protein ACXVZV_15125 [Terriglobales bacterium]
MRSSLSIAILLMALAPVVVAQSASTVTLADVARQSRAHAGTAKHTWDDQNGDFGRSTEDSGTPCGAPLPSVQNGYVSSLVGKPIEDPELSKALMRWLEKHPDLDVMHPEDLAKVSFPHSAAQLQLNQQTAHAAAEHWFRETVAVMQSGQMDPNAAVSAIVGRPLNSTAEVMLAQAVQNEQQRRVRSDGSAEDKLQEAMNLYSICESRQQAQFEPEVDKLAKQEFQKRIAELAKSSGEPAKHNAGNEPTKGM